MPRCDSAGDCITLAGSKPPGEDMEKVKPPPRVPGRADQPGQQRALLFIGELHDAWGLKLLPDPLALLQVVDEHELHANVLAVCHLLQQEMRGHQTTARASAPQTPKGLALAAPCWLTGPGAPHFPIYPFSQTALLCQQRHQPSCLAAGGGSWGNLAASPATAPLQEPCLSCIPRKRDASGHV